MKKLLFVFILVVAVSQLFAKEFIREIPLMTEIDDSYNRIQIPGGDSCRINAFFQKIDSLFAFGTGKINILHIGGSHVQADVFTNRIRRNLDEVNKDFKPSRGYIFPFRIAKTNNPVNYTVKYTGNWQSVRSVDRNREIPIGLGGLSVYTNDPNAEITVCLNTDVFDRRWDFDILQLIGYPKDDHPGVEPLLRYNSTYLNPILDKDSKTYYFSLPELADSFTICFKQKDAIPQTFILDGFIPQKDEEGIVYHSVGVNGATVRSFLESENFEDELKLIRPDMVIFNIGINDATGKNFNEESFIANYNRLVREIERVSPGCAFIFITNNDSFRRISRRKYAVNQNGLVSQRAFYRLAKQHKGGVWDLFALMGGLGSMQKWEKKGLAKIDKIHFTYEGYTLLGDLLYNALMNYYLYNDDIDLQL
ncbi:MAG: GDSL-type esterase/lipase family protein [Dysgonamonadaceae bacterium]|jgi:lysophospholipase L1-like esterase|nr:GDSL-type esterase/lipase family protein [Dysgonamonadaceae bacterium]